MTGTSIKTMWFRSVVVGCLLAVTSTAFAQHGRGGGGGHGGGGYGGGHGNSGNHGNPVGSYHGSGSSNGNHYDRGGHDHGYGGYGYGYGGNGNYGFSYGGGRIGIYLGGVYGSGQFGNYPYGGYAGYGYGYGGNLGYSPYGYYGNGLNSGAYYYRSGPQVAIYPGYAPGFYYTNPQPWGPDLGPGYPAGVPTPVAPNSVMGPGTNSPMTSVYPPQTLPPNLGSPAGSAGTASNDLVPGMVLPDGSIVVSVDPIPSPQDQDKNLPHPTPAPNSVPQPPPVKDNSGGQ